MLLVLRKSEPWGRVPQTPAEGRLRPPDPLQKLGCLFGSPSFGGLGGLVGLFEFLFDESGDLGELFFQAVDVCLHLVEFGVEGRDG